MSVEIVSQIWTPTVRRSENAEGYFAFHPYLPGVNSSGNTPEEAFENWKDAFALFSEHAREQGLLVPTPTHITARLSDGFGESDPKFGISASLAEEFVCG